MFGFDAIPADVRSYIFKKAAKMAIVERLTKHLVERPQPFVDGFHRKAVQFDLTPTKRLFIVKQWGHLDGRLYGTSSYDMAYIVHDWSHIKVHLFSMSDQVYMMLTMQAEAYMMLGRMFVKHWSGEGYPNRESFTTNPYCATSRSAVACLSDCF